MSLYRYLGGHMNYLADSTAKLCQGGYVGGEGVPVDNCSWGKM